GILVALCSIPLVTMPAALTAGIRHLRRYLQARDARVAEFFGDVRRALLPGGIVVGVAAVVVVGMLVLQVVVVPGTGLPGADAVVVLAIGLALVVLVLLCLACANWAPSRGWRHALGTAVQRA